MALHTMTMNNVTRRFVPPLLVALCGACSSSSEDVTHSDSPVVAAPAFLASNQFADGAGWGLPQFTSTVRAADFNGDHIADFYGRGAAGIYLQLGSYPGVWGGSGLVSSFFSDASGWGDPAYDVSVQAADVDGDGQADLVGRGIEGVWVQLNLGGGQAFGPPMLAAPFFNDATGWGVPQYAGTIRFADVNGDGMADIIGRGIAGVYVALAVGGGHFAAPYLASSWFSDAIGFGQAQYYVSFGVADVNGDGLADLFERGGGGVYVQLATGGGGFGAPYLAASMFTDQAGFAVGPYRYAQVADLNGDGRPDIFERGIAGVYVQYGTGGGQFGPGQLVENFFSDANAWGNPEFAANVHAYDLNWDGVADLYGRGGAGVYVELQRRTSLDVIRR
jgi:hypothetical protein